jgi:dihydrolipoamide dehydrogenase
LTQQKAEESGQELRLGNYTFRALGKSKAEGDILGGVKIIADKKSDKILGAHIIGAHATDLIHEVALAIRQGMTAEALGNMIHAHPVLSEAIMEAVHDVHGMSVHVPKRKV